MEWGSLTGSLDGYLWWLILAAASLYNITALATEGAAAGEFGERWVRVRVVGGGCRESKLEV